MATEVTANELVLSPEVATAAYEKLAASVIRPAFLHKLAQDYGIHPKSDAEIEQLEQIALLAQQHSELQQKQASAGNPILSDILGSMQAYLEDQGVAAGPTQHDAMLNKAASSLIQHDPTIEEAAAAYTAFLLQAGG